MQGVKSRKLIPSSSSSFFKDFIYLFLERGEGKEKERERNINVWLPLLHPLLGTWPATQACALIGNQTGDLLVSRPVLNPPSHTSQGNFPISCHFIFFYSILSLPLPFHFFSFLLFHFMYIYINFICLNYKSGMLAILS